MIALVLLAWSGFYLLLPKLGPAGAALVVELVVLGLAAIVALFGVLAGRTPRRRPVAAPRLGRRSRVWRAWSPASACPPRRSAPKVALAALVASIAVGALPLLGAAASGIDAG